jgi:hypothetical protein
MSPVPHPFPGRATTARPAARGAGAVSGAGRRGAASAALRDRGPQRAGAGRRGGANAPFPRPGPGSAGDAGGRGGVEG